MPKLVSIRPAYKILTSNYSSRTLLFFASYADFFKKNRQDNLSSIDQIIIEIPGNDLTPEEKLLKKDMEECMQQAIRQLPEKTRIVYCMAKEDHMSYKQISEALDISERTVNTHMTTAIRRLTENLQKYFR